LSIAGQLLKFRINIWFIYGILIYLCVLPELKVLPYCRKILILMSSINPPNCCTLCKNR